MIVCKHEKLHSFPVLDWVFLCHIKQFTLKNPRKNNHCFNGSQFGVTSHITVQTHYSAYPIQMQNKAQRLLEVAH